MLQKVVTFKRKHLLLGFEASPKKNPGKHSEEKCCKIDIILQIFRSLNLRLYLLTTEGSK